jgi:predicted kinase
MHAQHLSSDGLRKEMDRMGNYRPSDKDAVYREMLDRTAGALGAGRWVICDATFYLAALRKRFANLAERHTALFYIIEVVADEAVIRERVSRKRPDSEADFSVYLRLRKEFEPIGEAHLVLDTGRAATETLINLALDHIRQNYDWRTDTADC